MEEGFKKLVTANSYTPQQIFAWAGLSILTDVIRYMQEGKQLDRFIVDKMSEVFVKYY